jgi:FkbM family methyltransferase
MMISFPMLVQKYGIKTKGVVHVGAHWAEEHEEYLAQGIEYFIYIEPCEKAFKKLWDRFNHNDNVILINRACSDYSGKAIMYTGDNTVNHGQSNSLLKPDKHLFLHPEVKFDGEEEVTVDTLLNLIGRLNPPKFGGYGWFENFKLLVMDTQGTEGRVVRGAKILLDNFDYIYTEINFDSVYENCTQAAELDALLRDFTRMETGAKVGGMWSDSLYVRKTLL